MYRERISFTALPNGIIGNDLQIAVFISPEIFSEEKKTGSQVREITLGDKEIQNFKIRNWIQNVKNLEFRVHSPGCQPITVKPSPDLLDDKGKLWPSIFSDDTKVFDFQSPFKDIVLPIRTYPIRDLFTNIKKTYKTGAIQAAFEKKYPRITSPEYKDLIDTIGDVTSPEFEGKIPSFAPDQATPVGPESGQIPREKVAFYHAFKFYSRPELDKNNSKFRTTSATSSEPAPPTKPVLDFHQKIAALGDHPLIMRKLGLILILTFERSKLGTAPEGWIQVEPQWPPNESKPDCCMPKTHYRLTPEKFIAKERTDNYIKDGWLNLKGVGNISSDSSNTPEGQSRYFGFTELDVDGSVNKIINFAILGASKYKKINSSKFSKRSEISTIQKASNLSTCDEEKQENVALPSNRSAGIMLIHHERDKQIAEYLKIGDKIHNTPLWQDQRNKLIGSTQISEDALDLYAEDLMRGYRVDVADQGAPNAWHSICRRKGRYIIQDNHTVVDTIEIKDSYSEKISEGYVKRTSGTKSASDPKNPLKLDTLHIHQSLFSWNGWSLCVKRPGGHMKYDSDKVVRDDESDPEAPFQAVFEVPDQSLPALRFGHRYRIRVRAVDIAGNDMTGLVKSGTGEPAGWESLNSDFASDIITYHRHEPVSTPIMFPRKIPNEGESAERLVIRSCIEQPGMKSDAASYAKYLNTSGNTGKYSPKCERHFAPPKVSELLAENHGMFDVPFKVNAFKINESSYGIINARDKAAEDSYSRKYSSDKPHIVETPVFPIDYLPDPLASGMVFTNLPGVAPQTAKSGYQLTFIPSEATKNWPEVQMPIRLVLNESSGIDKWDQPKWDPPTVSKSGELNVYLPPGHIWRIQYNCKIGNITKKLPNKRDPHEVMALWNWMNEDKDPNKVAAIRSSAVNGQHWMLTPYREITLVHAVQKPLKSPIFYPLMYDPGNKPPRMSRDIGDTFIGMSARLTVDAKSTGKVELLAQWVEEMDDMWDETYAGSKKVSHSTRVFDVTVDCPNPDYNEIEIQYEKNNKYRHDFGDTKHRIVNYTLRATTRFREYFPPEITKDSKNITLTGDPVELNVLSSARPATPKVLYVIPIFGWDDSYKELSRKKGDLQTIKQRTRFGGGLRVYLDRPWYSSGDGELLGVVLWQQQVNKNIPSNGRTNDLFTRHLTTWGRDSVHGSDERAPDDLFPEVGLFSTADKTQTNLSLEEMSDIKQDMFLVSVAGYKVKYDANRHLWYADIFIDPGTAYFPFIKLALARYQPDSVQSVTEDVCLSKVVMADFTQLTPQRGASLVKYPNETGMYRLTVSGVCVKNSASTKKGDSLVKTNRVYYNLQKNTSNSPDEDLSWFSLSGDKELTPNVRPDYNVIWSGAVQVPPREANERYRLLIKEFEELDFDTTDISDGKFQVTNPSLRLVYAESFEIP